jgi:16S rRNA (guanine(1405)-N(7))-methyltransferase
MKFIALSGFLLHCVSLRPLWLCVDFFTSFRTDGTRLYNKDMLPSDIPEIVEEILSSSKYRSLNIPPETVSSLLAQELPRHSSRADALQAVREKLHNIIAPYLGDPNYPAARKALTAAFESHQPEQIKTECLKLLSAHASTCERIPLLDEFYARLWQVTGVPNSILDVACGLHPFGLPWMGLPVGAAYHAYDIHQPRVDLINHFLRLQGMAELAEKRDILLSPPEIEADVAIFFKEAHRFEQRQKGCNRAFWQSLNVRWLLVSLPSENLTGRRSLAERMHALVQSTLAGFQWQVTEVAFPGEIVFCIRKDF